MPRLLRGADVAMALLFAFATLVQFNDPDAMRWVAIYAVACGATALVAGGRELPRLFFCSVAVVAFAWTFVVAVGGPDADEYARMFDAWEMASVSVEEAREASGLLIVGVWMMVLFVRDWRRCRRPWRPELS